MSSLAARRASTFNATVGLQALFFGGASSSVVESSGATLRGQAPRRVSASCRSFSIWPCRDRNSAEANRSMISSSGLPSRSRIGSFSGPLGRPRLGIKGAGVHNRSGVLVGNQDDEQVRYHGGLAFGVEIEVGRLPELIEGFLDDVDRAGHDQLASSDH